MPTSPCRCRSPSCPSSGTARALHRRAEAIEPDPRRIWSRLAKVRAPADFSRRLARNRRRGARGSSRSRTGRPGRSRSSSNGRRHASSRGPTRSRCRRRGRTPPRSRAPRRASSRRRGVARFLAWLDAKRQPARSTRSTRREKLEELRADAARAHAARRTSPSTRSPGAGPERRHRPLPGHRRRPTASWKPASSIWSTPARSTSTAPPTSRAPSPSASRRARCSERFTLRAEGAHRHRHGALSRRARRGVAPRPLRAPRAVAGGPRLRPRHRPRRRQLPLGARGPAEHLQARHDRRSSRA